MISKSTFTAGLQCPKLLWHLCKTPELFKDDVHVHSGVTFIVDSHKAPFWTIQSSIDILAAAHAPRKIMLIGTISDYLGTTRTKYVTVAKAALAEAGMVIFYGPQADRVRRLKPDFEGAEEARTLLQSLR